MIDISDGLLADLGHLLDPGGLGARIETARLPISAALQASGLDVMRCALAGGEDFELLFAVHPEDEQRALELVAAAGTQATVIGEFTATPGTTLVRPDGTILPPPSREGFSHFGSVRQ